MPPVRRKRTSQSVGVALGFRSGLEEALAQQLNTQGIRHDYESLRIPFLVEEERKYTPDFILLDNGIIVESKGRFVTADRKKHKLVKSQHPDLDIRFVFSNSRSRISKQSQTTYAAWCEHQGFTFADKRIPDSWLREPRNEKSLAAIAKLTAAQKITKRK